MGYYNQALTDYVGKICDVERELYTTQRLIANLDYQMQRLGHPREVDPPEPTDGGNPFVQNGGWYMVFLLGIPISGVVRSISLGIVIAIALGVFGTVWGNIYQRAADREIRNEKWAKYDSAVAADKKNVLTGNSSRVKRNCCCSSRQNWSRPGQDCIPAERSTKPTEA